MGTKKGCLQFGINLFMAVGFSWIGSYSHWLTFLGSLYYWLSVSFLMKSLEMQIKAPIIDNGNKIKKTVFCAVNKE